MLALAEQYPRTLLPSISVEAMEGLLQQAQANLGQQVDSFKSDGRPSMLESLWNATMAQDVPC